MGKTYAMCVNALAASKARANPFGLSERMVEPYEQIAFSDKHATALLVAESDWAAIHDARCLLAVSGMPDSATMYSGRI